jgi:vacuolar-type H+-ATPase subunit E/Vma4
VALADIIKRIESDAAAEAARELSVAEAKTAELLDRAREDSEAESARAVEVARRSVEVEAATLVANARLSVRDQALTARRALVEEAFDAIVVRIEEAEPDAYVRFLAAGIVAGIRDGDSVALAEADAALLPAVRKAVEAGMTGVVLSWATEPAPLARGAYVTGPRTHFEVTARSVVEERRGGLEVDVAAALFGEGS